MTMSSISDDSPPQAENFRGLLFEMLEKHCFSCTSTCTWYTPFPFFILSPVIKGLRPLSTANSWILDLRSRKFLDFGS